jgi:hypothetical protein
LSLKEEEKHLPNTIAMTITSSTTAQSKTTILDIRKINTTKTTHNPYQFIKHNGDNQNKKTNNSNIMKS